VIDDASVIATTTAEEDRKTAGQRAINLKWESTQQSIAIVVTVAVLAMCGYCIVMIAELRQAAFLFLTNMAVLVITTYFQRTNHTKSSSGNLGETR
jgi:hypothetical protein